MVSKAKLSIVVFAIWFATAFCLFSQIGHRKFDDIKVRNESSKPILLWFAGLEHTGHHLLESYFLTLSKLLNATNYETEGYNQSDVFVLTQWSGFVKAMRTIYRGEDDYDAMEQKPEELIRENNARIVILPWTSYPFANPIDTQTVFETKQLERVANSSDLKWEPWLRSLFHFPKVDALHKSLGGAYDIAVVELTRNLAEIVAGECVRKVEKFSNNSAEFRRLNADAICGKYVDVYRHSLELLRRDMAHVKAGYYPGVRYMGAVDFNQLRGDECCAVLQTLSALRHLSAERLFEACQLSVQKRVSQTKESAESREVSHELQAAETIQHLSLRSTDWALLSSTVRSKILTAFYSL